VPLSSDTHTSFTLLQLSITRHQQHVIRFRHIYFLDVFQSFVSPIHLSTMAPLPFRHAQLFPLPTLIRPIAGIARSFSTASRLRASAVIDQNHYETLQIPYDASPGQIKKCACPLSFATTHLSTSREILTRTTLDNSTPSPNCTTPIFIQKTRTPQTASTA